MVASAEASGLTQSRSIVAPVMWPATTRTHSVVFDVQNSVLTSRKMEDAIIAILRDKHQTTKKGVNVDVRIVPDGFDQDSICDVWMNEFDGNYALQMRKGNYRYYRCDRYRKARGNSTGLPTQTRANSCKSYVSMSFKREGLFTACVIHSCIQHAGHSLEIASHKKVEQLDKELLDYIETLLSLGKTNTEVLLAVVTWCEERGHQDKHDRRYFPTPCDIKNIRQSFLRQTHYDPNDAISTDHLVKSKLRDEVVFFQPADSQSEQPLVVVLQSPHQLADLKQFGKNVVFVDASYSGLTAYGYAVYLVSVRNEYGHGVPVASFIMGKENTEILSTCFTRLREHAGNFYPRAFMVDKDMKLVQAIKHAYEDVAVSVLLCWFHVLQSVHRWLVSSSGGGFGGTSYKEMRTEVINTMRRLKTCRTKPAFEEELDNSKESLHGRVLEYLCANWMGIGEMWADLGRLFFHDDSDTNNISERLFLRLKYQFLKGMANRRVDDLLELLSTSVKHYFEYVADLQRCGRLKSLRSANQGTRERAEAMLQSGMESNVVWETNTTCIMPSQSLPNVSWRVNLLLYICDCPVSNISGGCKHMQVALRLASQKGVDVEAERKTYALGLLEGDAYVAAGDKIVIETDAWTSIYDTGCKMHLHCLFFWNRLHLQYPWQAHT